MDYEEGCTVILILGRAALDGRTYVAKNRDVPTINSPEIIRLSETGQEKTLGISSLEEPEGFTLGLNTQGVTVNTAGRFCHKPDNLGVSGGTIIKRSLAKATGAKEATELIVEIVGKEGKSKNGTAFACVDPQEAYIVETYQKKSETIGPLKNVFFAYGNYMLSPGMKAFEKKKRGEKRALRAENLLKERTGAITLPFLFRLMRDHETPPDLSLPWDDGNICTHGYERDSRASGICVLDRQYPRWLSVLWASLNLPCLTPFLPFYIGIREVPFAFTSARAYEIFEDLNLALGKSPSLREAACHFWEAFEYQTLREAVPYEGNVRLSLERKNEAKAEEMLTTFVFARTREALSSAEKMLRCGRYKGIL